MHRLPNEPPLAVRRALVLALVLAAAGPAAAQTPEEADFVPVTDAMLQNPADADWLMWRRTLDGWGFRLRILLSR